MEEHFRSIFRDIEKGEMIVEERIEGMTDKELAENSWRSKNVWYKCQANEYVYKEGFLDGLKEGRLKWHKVADGDLPPSFNRS